MPAWPAPPRPPAPSEPRRRLLGLAARGVAAGAFGSFAAIGAARAQGADALAVVASFSILADMTREVAGDWAQVTTLAGANADAHLFQPSPADVQRLARADLVVVNGLNFEAWLDRLIESSGTRGRISKASDGIDVRRVGARSDPHAWQSLARARGYARNIAGALEAVIVQRSAPAVARAAQRAIAERLGAYLGRIESLDAEVRRLFEPIPRERRHAITSHAAFGYFGDDYGITFTSLGGWSTESDASAAAVARLVRQVRAQRVAALFGENIADRRLLQRVAEETGAVLGGTLYSDALSPPGGPADTYLRLIEHNARTIAEALGRAMAGART
jgi:zinc/manganese transport system substrate-binding protein